MSLENKPNKAELHRRFSEEASKLGLSHKLISSQGIEAEHVIRITQLMNETGTEGADLIRKLAEKGIGPKEIPANLSKMARDIYHMYHPPVEPITIRTKTKLFGIFPFGGTISEKTVYITDEEPIQPSGNVVVTIDTKTFRQRVINKILNR